MTKAETIALLEENQNDKGIEKWNNGRLKTGSLSSYGIGLTALRKLAKQVGRNHDLAEELWESDVYDVKLLALLIDDPKLMTRDQVENQVDEMYEGYLAHVFSSCDAALAKTSFVLELASDWVVTNNTMRKRCGYGLLYEISKSKKKSAPSDDYFLDRISHMRTTYKNEHRLVVGAMGGALLGIGKRNKALNAAALKLAKQIGPIYLSDDTNCEPFDVVKHLTSDYIKDRLGL